MFPSNDSIMMMVVWFQGIYWLISFLFFIISPNHPPWSVQRVENWLDNLTHNQGDNNNNLPPPASSFFVIIISTPKNSMPITIMAMMDQ